MGDGHCGHAWSNVEVDSSPQFWNENKIAGKIRKEWWSITFLSFRFFLGVAICIIYHEDWTKPPQVGNPPNNSLVGFESWTAWVLDPLTSTKKGRARWPKRFLSGPVYLSTRSGRLKRAIPCFPFHVRLLDGHGGQSFQLTRGQVFIFNLCLSGFFDDLWSATDSIWQLILTVNGTVIH